MTDNTHPSTCVVCETTLVKNGRNSAGNQRWKCPSCGASSVRKRADRSRLFTLFRFIDWPLGKSSQADADGTQSGRSFRRRITWCWDLRPQIPITGVVHDVIEIDGFNLRTGWCILTARANGNVIAAQWCARESQAAWGALFARIPAPVVVVCDGGPGMHAALKEHWPKARVQRCLVHLQRNIRKYVTARSKTAAGQALWGLALKLTRVKTPDDAAAWLGLFIEWEGAFLHLTKERSYRKTAPEVPSWVRESQQWWYTHQRLRSGYYVLRRVINRGHLFTFLDKKLAHMHVPATTNRIEGGINSPMRLLLLHHRGMTEEHQRRLIEWWLYLHTEHADPARVLATHTTQPPKPARPALSEPDPGPVLYDTGLSAEEGLWQRAGWAGRG